MNEWIACLLRELFEQELILKMNHSALLYLPWLIFFNIKENVLPQKWED